MPIDPSIISNAFANASNNMPDVNALMQQRIQGAENIYKIEAGRQEQAAEAEKEAAQQAAEAMLPAVASAFSDPSDDGLDAAASMLPPEVSQAFTPFLQRLKGVGDTRQRMAILRAELAKDDEGRYILGQLEPTANMRLQAETAAGSQSLAERRLALDIQKAKDEAAGGGKIVQWITGDDGTVTGVNAQGGIVKTLPGIGKTTPATDASGVKLKPDQRLKPDGTVELIPGSATYNKQKSDFANDYKSAQASLQAINNLKTKVDTLAGTTGYQKMMNTGAYMTAIPNTPLASFTGAYDFQSKFDDVVSAVNTFGREIASMSGKLGNMAVQEWKNVAGSVANMDPSKMSSADLDRQLNSIATQLAIAENNVRNAYELEYGEGQFYTPLEDPAKTLGGEKTRPAGVGPDWTHMTDANGAGAWVSPDQKQIIEDQ